MKRRSIVQFEAWLDTEIVQVQVELASLESARDNIELERANKEVRLETLRTVKAKLAPVPDAETQPDLLETA